MFNSVYWKKSAPSDGGNRVEPGQYFGDQDSIDLVGTAKVVRSGDTTSWPGWD